MGWSLGRTDYHNTLALPTERRRQQVQGEDWVVLWSGEHEINPLTGINQSSHMIGEIRVGRLYHFLGCLPVSNIHGHKSNPINVVVRGRIRLRTVHSGPEREQRFTETRTNRPPCPGDRHRASAELIPERLMPLTLAQVPCSIASRRCSPNQRTVLRIASSSGIQPPSISSIRARSTEGTYRCGDRDGSA